LKSSAQSRREPGPSETSGFSFFKMFVHDDRKSLVELEDLRSDVSRITRELLLIYMAGEQFFIKTFM